MNAFAPTSRRAVAFLVAGVVAVAVYFVLPSPGLQAGWFVAIALYATAGLVWGARSNRGSRSLAWWLLGAGLALTTLGDVIWNLHTRVFHTEPFPSMADVAYLGAYPAFAAALILFVRHRRAADDLLSLLDALAVAVAASLPSWVFLISPASDGTSGLLGKIVSAAYPAADLVLLAVIVRLALVPGRRGPSYWLLACGFSVMLVADTLFAVPSIQVGYSEGNPVEGLYLVCYLLLAASALHPSMAELTETTVPERSPSWRWRVAMVGGCSAMAPILLVGEAAAGDTANVVVILTGWGLLLAHVLYRLVLAMRHVERAALLDSLTGLPNRNSLFASTERRLERRRRGEDLALLYLDLDGFKGVNDSLGHQRGDLVLIELAERLRRAMRPGDVVARLGGDEFVIVCDDQRDDEGAVSIRARIEAVFSEPFEIDGRLFELSASIGVSRTGASTRGVDALLSAADAAMYVEKDSRRI